MFPDSLLRNRALYFHPKNLGAECETERVKARHFLKNAGAEAGLQRVRWRILGLINSEGNRALCGPPCFSRQEGRLKVAKIKSKVQRSGLVIVSG